MLSSTSEVAILVLYSNNEYTKMEDERNKGICKHFNILASKDIVLRVGLTLKHLYKLQTASTTDQKTAFSIKARYDS